ncbi:MAG: ABC transporter permease [Kiritimatiellae bacterium]|nr:ABC transporter permease [Kiritimatiellia bacterium]
MSSRLSYLLRRLLLAIPTFLGITLVCFALTRILPGGPVEMRLARLRGIGGAEGASGRVASVTAEQRDELNRQFGFDRPFAVQYGRWLFHDAMGLRMPSYDYPERTAGELIASRFPVSIWFGITGFVLAYLVCIPLGMAKAMRHGTRFDVASSFVVFAGYALPTFALGMLLKLLFCGTVEGFPAVLPLGGIESASVAGGAGAVFLDRLRHMILPVACYVAGSFAMLTLMMKNSLLEQISSDYVRTAIAKGATPSRALWGHAFRNSLIPIATGFGSIFSLLFAGSVIIERIFEIPGMGRLSLDALAGRDYAVFMAILALTSVLQLLGNLLSDCCYMLIDPRIHFGK